MNETPPIGGGARPLLPSDLGTRLVSAIVLIVLASFCAWAGGWAFRLFAAAIAAAVLYEWLAMTGREPGSHRLVVGALAIVFLAAMVAGAPGSWLLAALVAAAILAAIHGGASGAGTWPAAGLFYALAGGLALAAVRGEIADGLAAIAYLFAVVWATDILAYFVGRRIGGRKLAPSISPGKTWSGAIGGTVGAVAAGVAVASVAVEGASLALAALLAVVLSIVSQIGDLAESALKRRFQVKDSGALIPGHGGVMDRVDGLVAAAAALALALALMGGPEAPFTGLLSH
jgi:phosphatidate cytidylyltransferase